MRFCPGSVGKGGQEGFLNFVCISTRQPQPAICFYGKEVNVNAFASHSKRLQGVSSHVTPSYLIN